MHCTTDAHTTAVFHYVTDLLQAEADDRAVARVLGSFDTLLAFGHVITREDLVAVFFAVREVIVLDLDGLGAALDGALHAAMAPDDTVRWLDRVADHRIEVAELVATLRQAESVAA